VPLNDKQRARLARDFQRAVARVAPDWTGSATCSTPTLLPMAQIDPLLAAS